MLPVAFISAGIRSYVDPIKTSNIIPNLLVEDLNSEHGFFFANSGVILHVITVGELMLTQVLTNSFFFSIQ